MWQSILLNYLASQRAGKEERANSTFLLHWCRIGVTNTNLHLHLAHANTAGKAQLPALPRQVPREHHKGTKLPLLMTGGTARTEGSGEMDR